MELSGGKSKLAGKFNSIVSLNISDNPIGDMRALVDDLNLLMPSISDL